MKKQLFKYIEVKSYKHTRVVKRLDVSDKTDECMDVIEKAINNNLNSDEHYTFGYDSEVEFPIINTSPEKI